MTEPDSMLPAPKSRYLRELCGTGDRMTVVDLVHWAPESR
jgi:hypothetical protein